MHPSDRQKAEASCPIISIIACVCVTGLALCVAVAVMLALLFPGKNSPLHILAFKAGLPQSANAPTHVPKDQIRADARTFIAAVRWLLAPEPTLTVISNRAVT